MLNRVCAGVAVAGLALSELACVVGGHWALGVLLLVIAGLVWHVWVEVTEDEAEDRRDLARMRKEGE